MTVILCMILSRYATITESLNLFQLDIFFICKLINLDFLKKKKQNFCVINLLIYSYCIKAAEQQQAAKDSSVQQN